MDYTNQLPLGKIDFLVGRLEFLLGGELSPKSNVKIEPIYEDGKRIGIKFNVALQTGTVFVRGERPYVGDEKPYADYVALILQPLVKDDKHRWYSSSELTEATRMYNKVRRYIRRMKKKEKEIPGWGINFIINEKAL
jgi:hypothetical protein